MSVLSTYLENAFVNAALRNTVITFPTAWYIALYTTNPTSADVGTEILTTGGTNYTRQSVIFSAPSGGACANSADVSFPVAGTNWGNITYAGIRDASTGGHLLFYGPLVSPRFVSTGDVLKFLTGNIAVSVS
jgi:hypothetical protein